MSKRPRSSPASEELEIGDACYAVFGRSLLQVLACGTPGPVVGVLGPGGSATLDPEAFSGEYVGELLSATLPRVAPTDGPEVEVPPDVAAAVAAGGPGAWANALPPELVAGCRAELDRLDSEERLLQVRARCPL